MGLASAQELMARYPDKRFLVIEKESELGTVILLLSDKPYTSTNASGSMRS